MRHLRILLIVACCAAFSLSEILCSGKAQIAGWGSETTNGVMAAVRKPDGTPAAGAIVHLRQSDYVTQAPRLAKSQSAILGADVLTDRQGRFEIGDLEPGAYAIEVYDSGTSVLFTCMITSKDTVNLGTCTLRPYAVVVGAADTSGTSGKRLFVQVLGLERLVQVDSAGAFKLDDLPSGLFSLRIIAVEGAQTTIVRTDQVSAVSGDTIPVTMAGWKFSRRLCLNTTGNAANVSGNSYNFPVLIHLTNSNFNFGQAKSDGGDLRFSKSDNTPLPFEIERWDAALGQAEVWVKIDTVYGNDSTHAFVMYWGASATSASNGATVFDTATGFQGVWHMGQSAAAIASDATANRFNGVPSSPSPAQTPGVVGMCQEFNGTSNFIQMPGTASGKLNFPEQGSYSIGAWVYLDTLDATIEKIIEKHDLQYKLQKSQFNKWEFSEFENANGYAMTTWAASEKTWVYLTGVRSGGFQYLYVNGECVTSAIKILASSNSRDTADNITIGRAASADFSPLYFFKGKIDETRIENRARSADWIKLCYMNQSAEDRLIVFK